MESLSIEDLSSINVTITKPDGTTDTIAQSYIVGMLADKWCIMHTVVQNRIGSHHFGIEDLTHYEMQHVDRYMNNLGQNAVIFVLNDYTPSPECIGMPLHRTMKTESPRVDLRGAFS